MIPFVELRISPIGSDPDMIENDKLSPLTIGVVENGSLVDRTNED